MMKEHSMIHGSVLLCKLTCMYIILCITNLVRAPFSNFGVHVLVNICCTIPPSVYRCV